MQNNKKDGTVPAVYYGIPVHLQKRFNISVVKGQHTSVL